MNDPRSELGCEMTIQILEQLLARLRTGLVGFDDVNELWIQEMVRTRVGKLPTTCSVLSSFTADFETDSLCRGQPTRSHTMRVRIAIESDPDRIQPEH
jgi:hypothetical protein